jgi:hypothetical protein
MSVEIVPLTKEDIPAAVECIQTAFADDPYFRWVFDLAKVCNSIDSSRQLQLAGQIRI